MEELHEKHTYRIFGRALSIPGFAGLWHVGQEIDVDHENNSILAVRQQVVPVVQSTQESPLHTASQLHDGDTTDPEMPVVTPSTSTLVEGEH